MHAQAPLSSYVNFEGSQTNPIRLSVDGTRLFAVNTADARLSVFDVTQRYDPRLIAEVPVGIDPVSVNPLTNDIAWVVNQVSDSISIVSVKRGIVIRTIYVKDEPSDIVFAGGRAFVSVSRSNEVRVFDSSTGAPLASIPLAGENPRALAANSAGSKIYVAFALSGNHTTIIPANLAPPQPAPTNPALPSPPHTGLIVDAADPAWNSAIKYKMPDNDVAEIDVGSLGVTRYFSGVGTINLGLAVHPTTGDIYVANWDSRNLVRFEPVLRGHTADHRIGRISAANGQVTSIDLNPGIDYSVLPNPAARAIALALPSSTVITPDGASLYVAAFGSDRVARVDLSTSAISRIEIGAPGATADPRHKRGPRGLALNASAASLYVLNRVSNTISIVNTATNAVVAEIPVGSFDPTPAIIRNGRGFLYDARLSGNGTVACAACHVDADMDLLAWDLGDPRGDMVTVNQVLGTFKLHPMKGPMTTLSLRGLNGLQPFHWRGDKADFVQFNSSFDTLLGGSRLSDADMAAFRDFISTIAFQPNPNQNLDRTLPAVFNGADPNAGRTTYMKQSFIAGVTCSTCHTVPGPGTDLLIFPAALLQIPQDMKVPQLRNMYQKVNFNNSEGGVSIDGFGFEHDGNVPTLFAFLSNPIFQKLSTDATAKNNVAAFLMCFDTGTAPAVGYTRTIDRDALSDASAASDWALLESQAGIGNIDLIAKGTVDGAVHGLLYRPSTQDYTTDRTGLGPFTSAQLEAKIASGDTLTFMGVPPGSGQRMGVDRNLDGILDDDFSPREPRPKR
jgi:YVTN family beta-propeller protein